MNVVNETAPIKEFRMKNRQEWFDRGIARLIHAGKKLFLKFKMSKLHNDEENLLRKKKWEFYETNLQQKINKPKKL